MKNLYTNKRVLVTGGAGFIGSHIVEQLVQYGAHVTVLDNLSSGTLENLATVKNQITFTHGSITDYATCLKAAQDCDVIFHCAAQVSVPDSFNDPQHCYQTNITGTQHMLEAARAVGAESFVFSSSSAVYGPQDKPCDEQTPCNPTSPYGYSKLIGEQLCQSYTTCFGLRTVCLRYFNVYGPRQNPYGPYAGVVAQFKKMMEANQPITLFGNGSQQRDFIPVKDIAAINLQLAVTHTTEKNIICNVATGKSITILELFKKIQKDYPAYVYEPQFGPARKGDIVYSAADCTKLNQLIRKD